jgi:putative transposase
MPNYRRLHIQGGTFFFTVVIYNRRRILLDEPIRLALRSAVTETRKTMPFRSDAWVLLPDHMHCIWTLPPNDDNYPLRWALIKQEVTRAYRKVYGEAQQLSLSRLKRRESSLWQRRFWEHQIRDERDFVRHVDYIHWNPVKHGLVTQAGEWPYSTFHRYVKEGVYTPDWRVAEDFDDSDFGE